MPSTLDELESLLGRLRRELEELEAEEERIRRRLQELPVPGGTLDYRWVRNSQGTRYWYWYLVYYRDGRRYHKYLGKTLRLEHIGGSLEELRLARHYAARLKAITKTKARIDSLLRRAERLLAEAESLARSLAAPAPAQAALA